jgi:hypothetical protein
MLRTLPWYILTYVFPTAAVHSSAVGLCCHRTVRADEQEEAIGATTQGLPEIPNGLALCKIHHSAYDANILGISPDLVTHVREDILMEIDGPMLEHGLTGMAGQTIVVPRAVYDERVT